MKKINSVNIEAIIQEHGIELDTIDLILEFYRLRNLMDFTLEFAIPALLLISALCLYMSFIHVSKDVKEMCKNVVFLKKEYFGSIDSVAHFFAQNLNVKFELYNYIVKKHLKVYKNNRLFFSENPWDKEYGFSLTYAEAGFIKNALQIALEKQNKK